MKGLWIGLCGVIAASAMLGGCVSRAEYDKCVNRNQIQQERIQALEAAVEAEKLRADQFKQQLDQIMKEKDYWQKKIDALQAALNEKNGIIDQLSKQVGQTALPPELSSALADWAKGSDLVEYDEKTGIVRFKSDLLFASGSDEVKGSAQKQIVELSKILNTQVAQQFDILIVGHTDDQPIRFAAAKHPTNWHLSAHRAISVEKVLASAGMQETRMSVMGLGEFRPIAPNEPNNRGNAKNRRVDIYIVPAGSLRAGGPAPAAAGAAVTSEAAAQGESEEK